MDLKLSANGAQVSRIHWSCDTPLNSNLRSLKQILLVQRGLTVKWTNAFVLTDVRTELSLDKMLVVNLLLILEPTTMTWS